MTFNDISLDFLFSRGTQNEINPACNGQLPVGAGNKYAYMEYNGCM